MDVRSALEAIQPYSNMVRAIPWVDNKTGDFCVYAVDGEFVPELKAAIAQQTFPELPLMSEIIAGSKPLVAQMILAAAQNPHHRPERYNQNFGVSFKSTLQKPLVHFKVVNLDVPEIEAGHTLLDISDP